jgi:hypothetical protein
MFKCGFPLALSFHCLSPILCSDRQKNEEHLLCGWIIYNAGTRQLAAFSPRHRRETQVLNL